MSSNTTGSPDPRVGATSEPPSHRAAIVTILVAVVLDILAAFLFAALEHLSVWLGLYWSVVTVTTVGYGDITPKTVGGHIVAVMVMITIVPLITATFSLFTSAITSHRIRRRIEAMETHHRRHMQRVHAEHMETINSHFHHMREHLGIPHPKGS